MLNTSEVINRLEEIMANHNLSAASFATKIGVQRSAISHILSGRNKPSLDFLMKVYESFDEVALEWLILGTTTSLPREVQDLDLFKSEPINREMLDKTKSEALTENIINSPTITSKSEIALKEIVHFYEDGTFERFKPKT
ncbi:helix-turn-helix domain-containing protein [Flavobacteriaceae bacterium]|nr:helix-turn-helix domain-containing protein [Flavobacteriaceae bacterium]